MKKFSLTDLLIFIVSTELVGAFSALLSGNFSIFYTEITRPPFSPPAWIFPVVWTVLYAIMGISAYMIYRSNNYQYKNALKIYIIQLLVNFSWSIIFFRFRLLTFASIVAVLLALLVGLMIYIFCKIKKSAGLINIPYFLWSI
ncbi:MAG: tryptophan-rich sensory protein, partial [Ruminococcus sp.]|nr:tryptophan-rich sensory protein [Ruminococcus sp.]